MHPLDINAQRLWQSLEDMARVGPGVAGGNRRLALTDEDKAGRDLFVTWAREAGCDIRIDAMGNLFAQRPGDDPHAPPVMAGSHLDTQPTGGRYDGVFGVLSALEVVRTLNDLDLRTTHPVEVVVWTNEEGSRFQPGMCGSGVFAGAMALEEAYRVTDGQGCSFGAELKRIGYMGDVPCRPHPIHAYLEAHIEQGPVLETERSTIGVVTGIQGMKWLKGSVAGFNAHAGTTPMEVRRDPLVGVSRMIDRIDHTTRRFRPDAVATVGMFSVSPGSINVINQKVDFSVDLRCPEDAALGELESRIRQACQAIAEELGLDLALETIWSAPATTFHAQVVNAVEQAAAQAGYSHRRMASGAGHDAKYLADICPTGMIFIPCAEGISHNEAERITPQDAAAGANVLLRSVVHLAGSGQALPL